MNAALVHIDGLGAVVIDLDIDRVIAESPKLRFAHALTRSQLDCFARSHGHPWRSDLLEGCWPRAEKDEEDERVVREPAMRGGCWALKYRTGHKQGTKVQCSLRARANHLTCGWHAFAENAAQDLKNHGSATTL